jgi:hypothetical protein
MSRFEHKFFEYLSTLNRQQLARPTFLGGTTGSGGGVGGPPGGFIGMLPQGRIAFDLSEAEIWDIPSSGESLLDNLNRIRYRVKQIEDLQLGGITLKKDDVVFQSGVTVLDFGGPVTFADEGNGEVKIVVVVSGETGVETQVSKFNKDLTTQVPSVDGHYDMGVEYLTGTLMAYVNGVRQDPSSIDEDVDKRGFTITFPLEEGDTLVVDYAVLEPAPIVGGGGVTDHGLLSGLEDDDHPFYLNETRGNSLYYKKSEIDNLLSLIMVGDTLPFEAEGDLLVGTLSGIGTPLHIGEHGSFLVVDEYSPLKLGYKKITVNQQIVFTVEGANLGETGRKNLKIWAHDVGTNARINEVFLGLDTPPGATPLRVDILKNGISIFQYEQYVEVPVGESTAVKSFDFADGIIQKDDYFQFEIVQGDFVASDLTIHIRFSVEV